MKQGLINLLVLFVGLPLAFFVAYKLFAHFCPKPKLKKVRRLPALCSLDTGS